MCWATTHEIPIPGASLGEPPGELPGQHAQAVELRLLGPLAHGSEAIAPTERARSIAELLGWESAYAAMSAIPLIPARGELHATRPNDCNASETASSKADCGRRHCKVDADKGRTTTDWWLPFEIGGRIMRCVFKSGSRWQAT